MPDPIPFLIKQIYDALGADRCAKAMSCAGEKEHYKYSNPNGEQIPFGKLRRLISFIGEMKNEIATTAAYKIGREIFLPVGGEIVDKNLLLALVDGKSILSFLREETPLCQNGHPTQLIRVCSECRSSRYEA
jgi:hypothetical protein